MKKIQMGEREDEMLKNNKLVKQNVVYFDQKMGALHTNPQSKSHFGVFHLFCQNRRKIRIKHINEKVMCYACKYHWLQIDY